MRWKFVLVLLFGLALIATVRAEEEADGDDGAEVDDGDDSDDVSWETRDWLKAHFPYHYVSQLGRGSATFEVMSGHLGFCTFWNIWMIVCVQDLGNNPFLWASALGNSFYRGTFMSGCIYCCINCLCSGFFENLGTGSWQWTPLAFPIFYSFSL